MKTKQLILILLLLSTFSVSTAQQGSYTITSADGVDEKMISGSVLISDSWISIAYYTEDEFIGTMGGVMEKQDHKPVWITYEYHTLDREQVGAQEGIEINTSKSSITLKLGDVTYELSDHVTSDNEMSGVWRISGRERNGEMREMTWGPRKTLKFLIGDMFQWVAFNSETGDFSGTGGGTFTAKNGEYVEKITFFSRDQSRVGAELPFNYELQGDDWIHSGLSSKGQPIKEIWKKVD